MWEINHDLFVFFPPQWLYPVLNLIFLISFLPPFVCLFISPFVHLSHPPGKLKDQFIKLSNGIIYQSHPIISSSLPSLFANKCRVGSCCGKTESKSTTGNSCLSITMNSWVQTSAETPRRSYVERPEALVSEPSGSGLLICLSSGSL